MKNKSLLCERWLWCVILITTTSAQRNCRKRQIWMHCKSNSPNTDQKQTYYVLYNDSVTNTVKYNSDYCFFTKIRCGHLSSTPVCNCSASSRTMGAKVWLTVGVPDHPKRVLPHQNREKHKNISSWPCFMHRGIVMLKQKEKGLSPNCHHKAGSTL